MEENNKSVLQPSLMYGIYLGFALIVYSLLLFLLDVDQQSWVKWISYVIMAGGLFWAMVSIRDKELGGYATYGKAFGIGFWTALFAAIISGIFTYIYVIYIDPGLIDEILLKAEESILESNPDMSDEQFEMALSMTEKFTSPVMITVWAFVANVIFGTILSLIIAIFAKRENNSAAV
jgi:ABC-type phosphate/phosphonate transport system permease subunit